MYKVSTKHLRKTWYHGDTSHETVIEDVRPFKTRREAKAWMLSHARGKITEQYWKKGNQWSYIGWDGSETWFDEGDGETYTEHYWYVLEKC